MPKVTTSFTGGIRLAALLRKTRQRVGPGFNIKMGFDANARYPDGTSVAKVAFWNEFGTPNAKHPIPPRPAIREWLATYGPTWGPATAKLLKKNNYDALTTAKQVGEGMKGQLVKTYVAFSDPPNAPATIARKGFNKPLIDTALLIRSIDYEVVTESP